MATLTEQVPTLEEIETAAAKLTVGQRGVLIERLQEMDEVHDSEIEAAWDSVIKRRIEEIDNGTAVIVDGDEVMKRMREKVGL